MNLPTRPFTIREFLDYDDGSDSHPYELVGGKIIAIGHQSPCNNTIAMMLLFQLFQIGFTHRQLAMGHYLITSATQATCRKPNLILHSVGSRDAIRRDGRILPFEADPPLLMLEVVEESDTDRQRCYIEKRSEYQARGIPEYWIIDPIAQLVMVLTLVDGSYQSAEFRGDEAIVSPTFSDLNLTAVEVLEVGR